MNYSDESVSGTGQGGVLPYLLTTTHQLLHEDSGALLLWRQVDLSYSGSEWTQEVEGTSRAECLTFKREAGEELGLAPQVHLEVTCVDPAEVGL